MLEVRNPNLAAFTNKDTDLPLPLCLLIGTYIIIVKHTTCNFVNFDIQAVSITILSLIANLKKSKSIQSNLY